MHHYYHIAESNFDYMFIITSEIYTTFLCFYNVNYCSLTSIQRTSSSIPCKTDLVVMTFEEAFVCWGKSLSPLPFLKDSLTGYRILGE